MIYRFENAQLDTLAFELTVDGVHVPLEPQVFEVLRYLVERHGQLCQRTELLDAIWGDQFVSDSALSSRVATARKAIGDDGRSQRLIRTVHGRGFRFIAEVTEHPGAKAGFTVPVVAGSDAEPNRSFARFARPANPVRGRAADAEGVVELLAHHRLVTVIGPGGIGKTRLAAEVMWGQDRPWAFVDLAAVRDGSAVPQALIVALGIEVGSATDELAAAGAFLRSEPLVLLVDNCEHVSSEAAGLVHRILSETESVSVLATSRVPLGLRDERLYRLGPLPTLAHEGAITPSVAMASPAVALFCDRVAQVTHDFALDEKSARHAVALCRALDGLPLALELAAARVGTFGVADLLDRLDDRLDLLDDERFDTTDRHRSLRATLDWSFDLLDELSRELFVQLSVFPSGMTLDSVEWMAERLGLSDPVHPLLDRLVRASLLERSDHPSGTRYGQLETMRTFGVDRLADQGRLEAARDLQVEWVRGLLADLAAERFHPWSQNWDDRIRSEIPNIRHARRHLIALGRHDELIEISVGLNDWGRLRDVSELWLWCDELQELVADQPNGDCRVEALAAQAAWRRGRVEEAERLALSALESGSDGWSQAAGYSALGVAKLFQGEFSDARSAWLVCWNMNHSPMDLANAAVASAYLGDVDEAGRNSTEAYRVAVETGAVDDLAWTSGR